MDDLDTSVLTHPLQLIVELGRSQMWPSLARPANARSLRKKEGAATGLAMARGLDVRMHPERILG
jgi:hypothetical protein